MRKNILVFGSVAGAICAAWLIGFMVFGSKVDFDNGELYGYASMLIAFSMIFVGVKNYRDKHADGVISFGKALRVGLGIAFVASTVYVVSWLIYYYSSGTDFMQQYSDYMVEELQKSGLSQSEIDKQMEGMRQFAEWYRNPFFNALMTYTEILPLGIIISLLAALIFKRKISAKTSI